MYYNLQTQENAFKKRLKADKRYKRIKPLLNQEEIYEKRPNRKYFIK